GSISPENEATPTCTRLASRPVRSDFAAMTSAERIESSGSVFGVSSTPGVVERSVWPSTPSLSTSMPLGYSVDPETSITIITSKAVWRSPAIASPARGAMSVLLRSVSPGLGVRISIFTGIASCGTASCACAANGASAAARANRVSLASMGSRTISRAQSLGARPLQHLVVGAQLDLDAPVLLPAFGRRVGRGRQARAEPHGRDSRRRDAFRNDQIANPVRAVLREPLARALVAHPAGVAVHDPALLRVLLQRARDCADALGAGVGQLGPLLAEQAVALEAHHQRVAPALDGEGARDPLQLAELAVEV